MHSSPPCLISNKTSAHGVANNVMSGLIAPELAPEGCGQRQKNIWLLRIFLAIPIIFCHDRNYWYPPPPFMNFHKTSAHRVASDVATRGLTLEQVPKGHQWQKRQWGPYPCWGKIPLVFHQSENLCIPPPLTWIPLKKCTGHCQWCGDQARYAWMSTGGPLGAAEVVAANANGFGFGHTEKNK